MSDSKETNNLKGATNWQVAMLAMSIVSQVVLAMLGFRIDARLAVLEAFMQERITMTQRMQHVETQMDILMDFYLHIIVQKSDAAESSGQKLSGGK